jgi:hypothetical protein
MTSALKNWIGKFREISRKPDFGGTICKNLFCFLILGVLDIVAEKSSNEIGFEA